MAYVVPQRVLYSLWGRMCIRSCLHVDVCLGRDAGGALWRNRGLLLGAAFGLRSGARQSAPVPYIYIYIYIYVYTRMSIFAYVCVYIIEVCMK